MHQICTAHKQMSTVHKKLFCAYYCYDAVILQFLAHFITLYQYFDFGTLCHTFTITLFQ